MRTKLTSSALLLAGALASSVFAADLRIETLSNKPHLISGGDALVRIEVPGPVALSKVSVTLDGTDVTSMFRPDVGSHALIGVVTGLNIGKNRLVATTDGPGRSRHSAELAIVNYPISGPIVSGPHQTPFICQTQSFRLPDGTFLGSALDADCSAPTRVHYLYRSTAGGGLIPLPGTTTLPSDVATTTTLDGTTVPFVVRVETGTMNRGIYQNTILHDPTREPAPSPLAPPKGWNKRLIAMHGGGCPGGWHIQGAAMGANILDVTRLGEGYALFINTLNHPSNSCNPFLAGETTMMGKEHFIETFGRPAFTVSTGCSGGAYTSLQIADAFPGLFDGVHISCTYPDALSIALSGLDSRLLSRYYLADNALGFSEAQIVAVSGHKNARAWYDLALQSGRTDPVPVRSDPIPVGLLGPYTSAVWSPVVPTSVRYHPVSNPTGARPTIFDATHNIYGVDPATGFALRPFDNVGVQYGLAQLNAGIISKAQFLHLNERVGGYDQDANYVASRTAGSVGAIRRAHQSGVTLGGSGGLASIPVFDTSVIYDDDQVYHYQWFHFAARARMLDQNGHTQNHVMWRGGAPITDLLGGTPSPIGSAVNARVATESWRLFISWVAAYRTDGSSAPDLDKVVRHKPAAAVDGCFTKSTSPQFIAEPQTLSSTPNTQCNALWPSWSFPRLQAGGPLHANTLKCRLRPLDAADYAVGFSGDEWARLAAIFPDGVCDWSTTGEGQTPVVPWASFGPSPVNQVFVSD
jgi:hypothetical protein